MQVTKLLQLPEITKGMSPTSRRKIYVERIRLIEARLKKGGMSPKLTQRATEYIASSQFKIRQIDAAKSKPRKTRQKPQGKAQRTVVPIFPTASQLTPVATDTQVREAISKTAKKRKPVDWRQGFLTNFLDQDSKTRIEEMVADRLFKHVAAKLDEALEQDDDVEAI